MYDNYRIFKDSFQRQYLRYRVVFYCQQIKDLLFRHRLFALFITLTCVSSLNNIKYIGYPIAILFASSANNYLKIIALAFTVLLTYIIAKSQVDAIKGGKFRNYVDCLYPQNYFNLLIDALINAIALNFISFMFFIAYINIGKWFVIDMPHLAIKFIIAWFIIMGLQISIISNNKIKSIICTIALGIITFNQMDNNIEFYLVLAIAIGILGLILDSRFQVNAGKDSFAENIVKKTTRPILSSMPLFLLQIGCMRDNANKFFLTYMGSFLISILLISLEVAGADKSIIVFCFILQTFILNLLCISLAKNESKYKILYHCFSYRVPNFKHLDILFVFFGYLGTGILLFFLNNINILNLLSALLSLIVSRYYFCYYRGVAVFMLLISICFNLLVVSVL